MSRTAVESRLNRGYLQAVYFSFRRTREVGDGGGFHSEVR